MAIQLQQVANQPRDRAWYDERYRELLRATVSARRTTFLINLIAWMLITLACALLPNFKDFLAPLALRLASMMLTIRLSVRLNGRIERDESLGNIMYAINANIALVGMSWALLLLPILSQETRHAAHLVVGCGVFIVVGSVLTTLSALRGTFAAFGMGFFVPIFAAVALRAGPSHWEVVGAFACLFAVMLGYTKASGQQRIIAADTIVANRRLTGEMALMLDRAEYQAHHDPLTGLYNRRALFEARLVDPQDRRRRHVLLVDLDHFKQLNDTYGHETGDRVLVSVANGFGDILEALNGDEHFAVRLGGEEFAVVLFVSDPDRAHEVAERIRFMVALTAGRVGLPAAKTTASIGLTHYDCGERIDDVFARADKAMYRAKSSGRNQVRRHAA